MPGRKSELTRREVLHAGAAASAVAFIGIPSIGFAQDLEEAKNMDPKLVRVPDANDIAKAIKGTEKVGIHAKTHEEHLKLWQGYANKTNEIRKALAELDTDPAKANQIYSQMRALKVNYAFAYGGYLNHNVYFETLGGNGGQATGAVADMGSTSCRAAGSAPVSVPAPPIVLWNVQRG